MIRLRAFERPKIAVTCFMLALVDTHQRQSLLFELLQLASSKTERDWT